MSPTRSFLDLSGGIKLLESRVAIRLQRPLKCAQMRSRMLSFAIWRVAEPHRRRLLISRRTIVPHVGPQSPSLGLSQSRGQHRNRDVISMLLFSSGLIAISEGVISEVILFIFVMFRKVTK